MCQPRKHLARIFFPAHCTCVNFFLDNSLVQEIFSYAHALAGYFFSKSPNPPPPQKLNGWPLQKCAVMIAVGKLTNAMSTSRTMWEKSNRSERRDSLKITGLINFIRKGKQLG